MKEKELLKTLTEIINAEEPFITAKELSEKIGVTKMSLHNWKKEGRIPYYKFGRRAIRFKLSEVVKRIN
tara:strand:+ start:45 stop:251 length:207 start_codon:yes stop_codon:yes gene_type:complete